MPIACRPATVRSCDIHCANAVPSSNGTHSCGSATYTSRPRRFRSRSRMTSSSSRPMTYAHGLMHVRARRRTAARACTRRRGVRAPRGRARDLPGAGEVRGAGEAVVAAADDDDVPALLREVADRRGQPDLAQHVGDRVHGLTRVGARDAVDELVDAVLLGSQRARPGERMRQTALHGLARRPVLPVGEVPEVDGVGRVEARRARRPSRGNAQAHSTCVRSTDSGVIRCVIT